VTNSDYTKHEVPASYLEKWQEIVDVVADVYDVPASLIMRVWPEQIEVLVSSLGTTNPYEVHEMADLGTGLYCETVMSSREQLVVPNALETSDWKNNPDVKLNMIHYFGVPLVWPDNSIFGTICVLDDKTRNPPENFQKLLWVIKEALESNFARIVNGEPPQ
jgi:GAF domain-containing protein